MAKTRIRRRWRVAAVQMTSTADVTRNFEQAVARIHGAREAGADLVALPENLLYLRPEGRPVEFKTELDGEMVSLFRELAADLSCHILLGSIPERIPRSRRVYNTSVLIDDTGRVRATYRKMHRFDIEIKGGPQLKESKTVAAGDRPVVARTRLGRLGLSICYDLRFPELYRQLALGGARVLFVPAAFTAYTGPLHWLPLLRARAIENQCYVVAPAQVGRHSEGRESHGETAVIDPLGKVIGRLPRRRGFVMATIDDRHVERARRGLPCLKHVRRQLLPDYSQM